MQTSVHSVIIGDKFAKSATLDNGDVALFDQDGKVITDEGKAAKATMLRVGAKYDDSIVYSQFIPKAAHPRYELSKHVEPKQSIAKVRFSKKWQPTVGHRFVIRVVYKDIDIHNQFVQQWDMYATSVENSRQRLVYDFVKKINADPASRVFASVGAVSNTNMYASYIHLKGKPVDTEGVDGLNEYSIVKMEVSCYETIPGGLLANQPQDIPGMWIEYEEGNPGVGYWRLVRDSEVRNMGNAGHVFTGAFPSVEQIRRTKEDVHYDVLTVKTNNPYLSNDNQYYKTTPITVEVYCPGLTDEENGVGKLLQAFISGEQQNN